MDAVPRKRQGRSLTDSNAFKALVGLLSLAVALQFLIIFGLVTNPNASESLKELLHRARVRRTPDSAARPTPPDPVLKQNISPPGKTLIRRAGAVQKASEDKKESEAGNGVALPQPEAHLQPHLYPRVPPLPAFVEIPDAERLSADTIAGRPTIAGITAILNKFLTDAHISNRRLASDPTLHVGPSLDRDRVYKEYMQLIQRDLIPLDAAYRERAVFPVRDDNSVFVSLASYRDYLLGETLKELFEKAEHPERLFVGAVVQNCFGVEFTCRTGVEVVGTDKNGHPKTKVSDAPPDKNGVAEFCEDSKFSKYCESGQIRALYVNETEANGPTMARYMASKLWGGEKFYMQVDSHLQFAEKWDDLYIAEVKAASSYPKAVLSTYPPGFEGFHGGGSLGSRLCSCEFSVSDVEDHIIRIGLGPGYKTHPSRPRQIAFIAAGFFFAHADFLTDVPFDPFLPWCFMGEEILLSMRAWTHGWNIYAPRKNWIAHQYRPGRMGLPKFWESVGRLFHRPGPQFSNRIQEKIILRVKHIVGYPDITREKIESQGDIILLEDLEHYGTGTNRSRDAYIELTNIDFDKKSCNRMDWCSNADME